METKDAGRKQEATRKLPTQNNRQRERDPILSQRFCADEIRHKQFVVYFSEALIHFGDDERMLLMINDYSAIVLKMGIFFQN